MGRTESRATQAYTAGLGEPEGASGQWLAPRVTGVLAYAVGEQTRTPPAMFTHSLPGAHSAARPDGHGIKTW